MKHTLLKLTAGLWLGLCTPPAVAHPHVFVDGGVDLVFGQQGRLQALNVTWLYDEFETLYILASHGLALNEAGDLSEADRLALIKERSTFPDDFDGSAHLTVKGDSIPLQWPEGLDAQLVDGRLKLTFMRQLETPMMLPHDGTEVAFYESTYFFAFKVTEPPRVIGDTSTCKAVLVPFKAEAASTALLDILATLSREETPENTNVGANFADRIVVTCG